MADRLSALDASFLYFEEPTTPMHVGGVAVFARRWGGFDYERIRDRVSARICLVPRYRQKVMTVPARLGNPVWVDDVGFDLGYHVRHSALPKPGDDRQLADLVGRLMSRRLDRHRPLWEMYLVEGLSGGRFAVVTKTHHAMVDGISAIDLTQVILDTTASAGQSEPELWMPAPPPSRAERVATALTDIARRPGDAPDAARATVTDLRTWPEKLGRTASTMLATARHATRPAPPSPLNAAISGERRYATLQASLRTFRDIRGRAGGTVNDVVLAVVSGALRAFLMSRGEPVGASNVVRAMVPVSVRDPAIGDGSAHPLGNRVLPFFLDFLSASRIHPCGSRGSPSRCVLRGSRGRGSARRH